MLCGVFLGNAGGRISVFGGWKMTVRRGGTREVGGNILVGKVLRGSEM